jgi:hypothetical protein
MKGISPLLAGLIICLAFGRIASAADQRIYPVQLLQPLEFSGFTINAVNPVGATRLMEQKIKSGASSDDPDAYDFLVLPNSDHRLHVETANEYLKAIKKGAAPYTTYDLITDGWFQQVAGTLKFIEQAKPSKKSYLPDDLSMLSVAVLDYKGSDWEAQFKQDVENKKTLKDFANSGKIKKMHAANHQLKFQTDEKEYFIDEMARGDFDGDGVEDALIFVTKHHREGSGVGYELFIIRRTNAKDMVCRVKDFDFN